MPKRDLDRRMPFAVDEMAAKQLDSILLRAGTEIEKDLRTAFNEEVRAIKDKFGKKDPHVAEDRIKYAEAMLDHEIERNARFKYVLACSDHTSDHRLLLDELLNFPNFATAKIQNLTTSVGSYDRNHIDVELRIDPWSLSNIRCTLRGDNRFINHYGREMEDWFASIRKKYFIFYKGGIASAFLITILVILSTLLYLFVNHLQIEGEINVRKNVFVLLIISLMVSSVITPLTIVVGHLLFPVGEFAIGRGKKRQTDREYLIYGLVGVVVCLGLVVTVFGNFVSALLVAPTKSP